MQEATKVVQQHRCGRHEQASIAEAEQLLQLDPHQMTQLKKIGAQKENQGSCNGMDACGMT